MKVYTQQLQPCNDHPINIFRWTTLYYKVIYYKYQLQLYELYCFKGPKY